MLTDFLTAHTINSDYKATQIGSAIESFKGEFPDLSNKKLAIIGVNQKDQGSGGAYAADAIRAELYRLSINPHLIEQMVDLGNIEAGASFQDTEVALKTVVKQLRGHGMVCMVLGGTLELAHSLYATLEGVSNNVDISLVSAELPILNEEVLARICSHKPNYLFNINALGFQSHFVPYQGLDFMNKLGFNQLRLGELKSDLNEAEPLIRNTHMLLFDMGAIKQADAPGSVNAGPSGMEGDMACKLSYYAGVSDLTNTFALFEMEPQLDHRNQTAKLAAQMLWYFMDGFANRVNDHPQHHQEFYRYRCNLDHKQPDIIFHKSKRTSRWWMEIPNPRSVNNAEMNVIVPCSYTDYQVAAKGDIPERYLKTLQKMH